MTTATFNATGYSGLTPENYEKFFVPAIGGPLAKDLIAAASPRPGERILDVACGTGVVARLAAEQLRQQGGVAGLDVNPGMLSVARSVTPKEFAIDWFESSAEAMPLPDASFDVVLCQMGLQFIPNKRKALQEIRRIARPDGRVLLSLPGPMPALFAVLAEALAKHFDPNCAGFVNVVFSLHDADELQGLMFEAGFSEVEIRKTNETLRLPGPQDFLWQYIYSTPLAAFVEKAGDEQREALLNEISARWQEFVVDGGMNLELAMTTVHGK